MSQRTGSISVRPRGFFLPLAQHPAFDKNRCSPPIRNAFAPLYGTEDLHVTIDHGGFNAPGWDVPRLRRDISLAPPFQRCFEGVLDLTDTPAEQRHSTACQGFTAGSKAGWRACPRAPRAQDLSAEAVHCRTAPHYNYGMRPRLVQYIAASSGQPGRRSATGFEPLVIPRPAARSRG